MSQSLDDTEDDFGFPLPMLAEDEAEERASRELCERLLIERFTVASFEI